ncbi:MAG: hypothetical protein ACSLFP_15785 [Acidimicrobiales bacterium]
MNGFGSTIVNGVEPAALVTRAEIARLSLAVRTARRETELQERRVDEQLEQSDRATELLARQLGELVENRRRECERELAERRDTAERSVRRAPRIMAPPALDADAAAAPPVEVAKDASVPLDASPAEDEKAGDEVAEDEVGTEAAGEPATDGQMDLPPAPSPRVRLSVVNGSGLEPMPHPAVVEDVPKPQPAVAEGARPTDAHGQSRTVTVAPDELRALIQAAVVAGLREAMEHAVATMHLAPALAHQLAPAMAPRPARVVEEVVEPSFRQRLLHLDVLLPLVAALIVIVLFFAWIG